MRPNLVLPLFAAMFMLGGRLSAAETAPRPNILVILTDDVGWGDYQCYNAQGKIPSPNVDKLAREGMRFTHAHTPAALCSPTRYSMVTGNFPWRGRDPGGTWGFNTPSAILPGQKTVANLLQTAGYRTAMFGKQGFGGQHALLPDGQPDFSKPMTEGPISWGFDYSFLIPRGHQAIPLLFLENEIPSCGADKVLHGEAAMQNALGVKVAKGVKKGGKKTHPAQDEVGPGVGADYFAPGWDSTKIGEELLAHAEKFLDDVLAKNKASGVTAPFFMHFCSDGAHAPYTPAEAIRGSALKGQTKMSDHTDMVMETDILLNKLTEALAKRGLLDNTIICFTSDNGGLPHEREEYGHDAVGGLKGAKSMIAEGGHRVPFIVRWPGKIPANTVRQQPVCAFDIVPTALELAGVKIPAGQCRDAVSLVPVLLGQRDDSQPVRRTMLVQSSPGRDVFSGNEGKRQGPVGKDSKASDGMAHAVYEGDWKLLINIKDEAAALYDLKADLAEKTNLLAEVSQAERVKRLEKIYRDIRASKTSTAITAAK
ncbi:MAG: arylsulfatase [Verrucomicrobia bacterium]|nr:arylsulfatase [Verrucomicrobiota bacterium]